MPKFIFTTLGLYPWRKHVTIFTNMIQLLFILNMFSEFTTVKLQTEALGDAWRIIPRTQNKYLRQQVHILSRRLECKLSSVASGHDSAMSAVMIYCPKSYYREQWKVVLAKGGGRLHKSWKDNIKEWTGQQTSHCRRCCALQTTVVDGNHYYSFNVKIDKTAIMIIMQLR